MHRKQNIFILCVRVCVCIRMNEWSVLCTHLWRSLFVPQSSQTLHTQSKRFTITKFFSLRCSNSAGLVTEDEKSSKCFRVIEQMARYLWCVQASHCLLPSWMMSQIKICFIIAKVLVWQRLDSMKRMEMELIELNGSVNCVHDTAHTHARISSMQSADTATATDTNINLDTRWVLTRTRAHRTGIIDGSN